MFNIILWSIAFCGVTLLVHYSSDGPKFKEYVSLKMPSVYDLEEGASIHQIDDYVKDVICPANSYFTLCNQICRDAPTITPGFFLKTWLFIELVLSVNYQIQKLKIDFIANNKTLTLICISVLLFFLCWLLSRLLKKLYTLRYSLDGFYESLDFLKKHSHSDFSLQEDRAFQNKVILSYYNYLLGIEKKVRRRIFISKILEIIDILIYILFFPKPEP